ncbi:MAG: hypothetical protein AAB378_00750 [Patescibacteria group bacterium]
MTDFFKKHYLAVFFAVFVGLIYIIPGIFFLWSLGDHYKGIPMMQTANEISYLARIREILDGHPMLGSPFMFEYKDEWPIAPPIGEMFYAVPSMVLNVSPINVIIASRFFFPFILFLLVYFLIYHLSDSGDNQLFSKKINAVAGALLVTLGYDLVDYRSILSFLSGEQNLAGNFLIWARPVNPILGAMFLMSFLIFIWFIIRGKSDKKTIVGAATFLALMIGSYFFSWGMAVSVVAMLVLIYLLKKDYRIIKNLIAVVWFGLLLASPYWYISWQVSQSPWYEDSLLRSGLFYTHYPLLNKLTLAILALYIVVVLFSVLKHSDKAAAMKDRIFGSFKDWHWFCLALILGSLWTYSQQIITGRTVWPYHFVQYSIPLAMIVFMVLLYNIVRKESAWLWRAGVFAVILASLSFGIYTQASVYNSGSYGYYRNLQSYAPLFDELNKKEKDCVVLVREDGPESKMLNVMIPAFTHCNRYSSTEAPSLMPNERSSHGYLVALRFNGVEADAIDEYLQANKREARGHLYSNWLGVYGHPANDFPDFSDRVLEQRLKEFPENYRQFMARDFKAELNKYRLDYILSVGSLPKNIVGQLDGVQLIFDSNNLFLYTFSK